MHVDSGSGADGGCWVRTMALIFQEQEEQEGRGIGFLSKTVCFPVLNSASTIWVILTSCNVFCFAVMVRLVYQGGVGKCSISMHIVGEKLS